MISILRNVSGETGFSRRETTPTGANSEGSDFEILINIE